jgi:hypothetical protein
MKSALLTVALAVTLTGVPSMSHAALGCATTGPGQTPFVPNRGQAAGPARFYATSPGSAVYFEPGAVVLDRSPQGASALGAVLRLEFASATRLVAPEPARPLGGRVNIFTGSRAGRPLTGLPTYGEIRYRSVAPGADLVYRMAGGRLEYDVVLAPRAELAGVRFRYRGADRIEAARDGRLRVRTAAGVLEEAAPKLYQEIDGERVPVRGGYRLLSRDTFGFWAATYDPEHPLVVDPGILWSTFLGGTGNDCSYAVTTTGTGDILVAGYTLSTDYPVTPGVYQGNKHLDADVFVSKLRADGTLAWSTYLGGARWESARAVAVDNAGNIYLCGETLSSDFPVTPGAFRTAIGMSGTYDAFVTKLSPNGNALSYSTYLGGISDDYGTAIAVNASGEVTIGGDSGSNDFPTTAGVVKPTRSPGFFDGSDGFVAKLNTTGSALVYATYVGSNSNSDLLKGVSLDASGQATITGWTASSDFPTTTGAWDRTFGGSKDAYVARLNATATAYVYSTFLGGAAVEEGRGIAVDAAGNAVVAGFTNSTDFPTTAGAYQRTFGGGTSVYDAFLVKISPTGGLAFGSYLGGSGSDAAYGVKVASGGQACIVGATTSTNFPVTAGALAINNNGGAADGFVTAFSPSGSSLAYSTYLGSAGNDQPQAVVIRPDSRAAVVGFTDGSGFPTTVGAYDRSYAGSGFDNFVTVMDLGLGGTTGVQEALMPRLRVASPAPNPFRSSASISLSADQTLRVRVRILDVQGREVRSLADQEISPGPHTWLWDGQDQHGREVEAGVYLVDVDAAGRHFTRLLARLR